jgi:hypothetical protein
VKIQEVSEDVTMRRNSIPSPRTSFMEENTQKDEEKDENAQKNSDVLPHMYVVRLSCVKLHWRTPECEPT